MSFCSVAIETPRAADRHRRARGPAVRGQPARHRPAAHPLLRRPADHDRGRVPRRHAVRDRHAPARVLRRADRAAARPGADRRGRAQPQGALAGARGAGARASSASARCSTRPRSGSCWSTARAASSRSTRPTRRCSGSRPTSCAGCRRAVGHASGRSRRRPRRCTRACSPATRRVRREKRYVRPDGTILWAAVTASLLRTRGRSAIGMVEDITERKEIERIKDELVSVVGHELRTPLTSIRGSLGLLEAGVAGELPAGGARDGRDRAREHRAPRAARRRHARPRAARGGPRRRRPAAGRGRPSCWPRPRRSSSRSPTRRAST